MWLLFINLIFAILTPFMFNKTILQKVLLVFATIVLWFVSFMLGAVALLMRFGLAGTQ
jgi:hypothetical protein